MKEKDTETAKSLLIQAGYIKEEKHELSGFWKSIEKLTRNIPWVNKSGLEVRLVKLVMMFLLLFPIGYLVYIIIYGEQY